MKAKRQECIFMPQYNLSLLIFLILLIRLLSIKFFAKKTLPIVKRLQVTNTLVNNPTCNEKAKRKRNRTQTRFVSIPEIVPIKLITTRERLLLVRPVISFEPRPIFSRPWMLRRQKTDGEKSRTGKWSTSNQFSFVAGLHLGPSSATSAAIHHLRRIFNHRIGF